MKTQVERRKSILLSILGVALGIRAAWAIWGKDRAPLFDDREYLELGKAIAYTQKFEYAGSPFREFTFHSSGPEVFRPPFYPAFIAALYPVGGVFLVLLAQAVLGTLTTWLVFQLARRHFSETAGLIAAALYALSPLSSRFCGLLWTETLFTTLGVAACLCWSKQRFVWAGVLFGLATLTRPTSLPFVLALGGLLIVPQFRRAGAVMLIAMVLTIAPWTVRNWFVFHRFIPLTYPGGEQTLYAGTFVIPFGRGDMYKTLYDQVPEKDLYEGQARELAIQRIKDNPIRWLKARATQYPRLFTDSGEYLQPENRIGAMIVKVAFLSGNAAVLLLAAYALWSERRRLISLAPVVVWPLFLLGIHLPLWIETRYGIPIQPFIAILAAVATTKLLRRRV